VPVPTRQTIRATPRGSLYRVGPGNALVLREQASNDPARLQVKPAGTFFVAEDLLTNVWLHQQVMLKLADGRMLDGLRV
jgi:hypothetical protein